MCVWSIAIVVNGSHQYTSLVVLRADIFRMPQLSTLQAWNLCAFLDVVGVPCVLVFQLCKLIGTLA